MTPIAILLDLNCFIKTKQKSRKLYAIIFRTQILSVCLDTNVCTLRLASVEQAGLAEHDRTMERNTNEYDTFGKPKLEGEREHLIGISSSILPSLIAFSHLSVINVKAVSV